MTEHFTVHQGDGCCSLSPSCCPALGSDHFLCHFSFPAVLQGQHVRHASGPADACPVVRDWEPIFLAARTELDSWAAAVQESSSEEVVELPQRCAKVSALFDDLLRILWDTARLIHPRQTPMHRRRPQPRWWTGECFRALVARNAAWRDFRRSNLPADYVRFSSCRLYFHRLVCSTYRGYWSSWQDDISWMRIQNAQACASRIRRCFRSPTSRTAPHDSMIWRTPQAGTARPCDGWRDHFSSVVMPSTHDDFSSEFHCSMTLRFFELTSDRHSSGVFDAPFSESKLSRALSKCHDSAPGLDGLRYSTFQQHLPWWRAMLLDFFNLLLCWNVVPSVWKLSQVVPVFKDGDPADRDRYRPISLASCAFKDCSRHLITSWTIVREVSDGARMLVWMGSSTRSGSARTPIHFAPSLTFGRLSTRHGLRQHSFVCTSPASLVACGAPLPCFSVGRSPRCEFEETSRLHGWTQGLHRGACFHPCCLISW